MTRKLFGVLFMTLLAQDVLGGPVRLGPTAGYLTDADALAIGRLFDGTRNGRPGKRAGVGARSRHLANHAGVRLEGRRGRAAD
jgi:hypothetical protein